MLVPDEVQVNHVLSRLHQVEEGIMMRGSAGSSGLVQHLEYYLGSIESGGRARGVDDRSPVQMVRYEVSPSDGIAAYSTLGLSKHELESRASGECFRLELLMIVPDDVQQDLVYSRIDQVSEMLLDAHRAILRGQIIGPSGPLFPNSDMTALYASLPVLLPDEFAVFHGSDGDVAIVWLIPISTEEAEFVLGNGWRKFEDELVAQAPNLIDVWRPSLRFRT